MPPPSQRPCLIIVAGLPGAGKSSFSRALAARLPVAVVESDAVRKALYPSPTYDPREHGHVFIVCHILMDELLAGGRSVIFDATNLQERNRRQAYRIAERHGAKVLIVWVQAPADVARARLERRVSQRPADDISDADVEIYERLRASVERIGRPHLVVDTSRDIEPALRRVLAEAAA